MDDIMAPPAKRRRLSSPVDNISGDTQVAAREGSASFFHGIEHLEAVSTPEIATQLSPHHVEEVHLEIRNKIIAEHAKLHPRQGTAGSADATATGADVVVSVVASVDEAGSTIGVSTQATVTVDLANLSSFSATSTTTLVASPDVSSSSSADVSSSGSSSSDASSTAASSSFTPTTTGQAGFIGISAGTAGTASAGPASFSDASASNSSSTTTEPASLTGTGSTILPQSLTSSSNRLNLTTSTTTYTSGGSTFTSQSTIDLASLTSSSASRSSHASPSTSSFDTGVVYFATLSGGRVATITRSSGAYATTFPGGMVSTISPYSSSGSSQQSSSGSVTEITTDGSTVRSTVYSTFTPSSTQAPSTGANGVDGAAGLGQGTATSDAPGSTSSAAGGGSGSSSTPPAGTIAGGVVGGAAGLAVIVLIAMMFLRWYRRRSQMGHQALPPNSAALSPDLDQGPSHRGQPGMAERAGLMPFAAAVPALFRHQNRSRESDASESNTGERGFTRVSGRKLPSAWSEGMTAPPQPTMSPPPTMPLVGGGDHDRNLSSTSFYRDSTGFYGGESGEARPASPNPFADLSPINTNVAQASDGNGEHLIMSPGPQRTPTVHHGGPYVMSPSTASSDTRGMLSPGAPPWSAGTTATFTRSETPVSLDGSRGSRFMEEV